MIAVFLVALLLGVVVVRLVRPHAFDEQPPDDRSGAYVTRTEQIMAAPISVLAPASQSDTAATTVFEVFRGVDRRMSEWKSTSQLSAVNANAGQQPVPVPDDLRAVLRRGKQIGEMTDGAFDITWAALWGLWDFKEDEPTLPDTAQIKQRVGLINYRLVEIDDDLGTVFLPAEGMLLGLGGIAKGYALDQAASALREKGVDSFLISAGGQVMVGGRRSGQMWRVGIRDPRGQADDYFAYLELSDTSVATSGDYERHFILDGVRYHHILDPRTGMPTRGMTSATVVSADATLADALSTSLIVLGVEKAIALTERTPGVEAVLVDDQGKVHVTSGLKEQLVIHHPPSAASD